MKMRHTGGTKRKDRLSRIGPHMAGTVLLALAILARVASAGETSSDIVIDGTRVFPENLSATSSGDIFIGSVKGIVFKAEHGSTVAQPWMRLSEPSGDVSILGVWTDEARDTLWLCVNPNLWSKTPAKVPAALVAVSLDTGEVTARYPFPETEGVCNDAAVSQDGTVYATDTPNGRILTLAPGAKALGTFGQDPQLNGIDGIAFGGDGTLYVNTVTTGHLLRVGVTPEGKMGELTVLETSMPLSGPDGFRPVEGNRFILAEGMGGRVDEVTIDGNKAEIRVLTEDLGSPPGVTLVGETVYAVDGKIGYLIDPNLQDEDPGTFKVHAIPLRGDKEMSE